MSSPPFLPLHTLFFSSLLHVPLVSSLLFIFSLFSLCLAMFLPFHLSIPSLFTFFPFFFLSCFSFLSHHSSALVYLLSSPSHCPSFLISPSLFCHLCSLHPTLLFLSFNVTLPYFFPLSPSILHFFFRFRYFIFSSSHISLFLPSPPASPSFRPASL